MNGLWQNWYCSVRSMYKWVLVWAMVCGWMRGKPCFKPIWSTSLTIPRQLIPTFTFLYANDTVWWQINLSVLFLNLDNENKINEFRSKAIDATYVILPLQRILTCNGVVDNRVSPLCEVISISQTEYIRCSYLVITSRVAPWVWF